MEGGERDGWEGRAPQFSHGSRLTRPPSSTQVCLDHAWRIVRRAAGHPQTSGVVERVFVISAGLAVVIFSFWFLVIAGPGPELAPWHG